MKTSTFTHSIHRQFTLMHWQLSVTDAQAAAFLVPGGCIISDKRQKYGDLFRNTDTCHNTEKEKIL